MAENWRVLKQNYKIFETAIELDKKKQNQFRLQFS